MANIGSHESATKYWETLLKGLKPCRFPTLVDRAPKTQVHSYQESTAQLDISSLAVNEFCTQHHVTPGGLLRTAWAVTVGSYAGVDDVSFGYSCGSGTSICRTLITADQLLSQTMHELTRVVKGAARHGTCSIPGIEKLTGMELRSMFNSGLQVSSSTDLDVDGVATPSQGMVPVRDMEGQQYDIFARVLIDQDSTIAVSIRTLKAKISASQTANVAHTLAKVVTEILDTGVESTIGDLDIFSQRDYNQVMEWNKIRPQAVDNCFHHLVRDIAKKRPDSPAICSWDRSFTYGELDTLTTKVANRLVSLGAGPEVLVLVCFDKSSLAVAAMLSIFKAGGAFVAMDPSYPASRIRAIAEATKASIVISDPAHCRLFEGILKHVVGLDHKLADELPSSPSIVVSTQQASPSNTAYVVFTSGSTGAPKGIMVEHRALCTAALSLAAPMRVDSSSRFLQFAAYTFDLSYGDIFVTLSQGGCICVPSEHERLNDLVGSMVRMRVNTACMIPSVARIFQPGDVPGLKTLLLGGEALLQESLEVWASKVYLAQMYGPSEAVIWCTSSKLMPNSAANNIGRGLAAVLWVVSATNHDHLCPIGCIGELLIEGPVLARGYLGIEQTRLSFVENPRWAQVEPGEHRRFYKTGDLVRYDTDGSLRFVGRKDTQIKYNGRRIEMGEIEFHLSSHELLRQSLIALPTAGVYNKRLVAVVVLKSTKPSEKSTAGEIKTIKGKARDATASEVAQLKDYLASKVPAYMLPQYWVAVEEIPLMISGKMNRVLTKKFLETLDVHDDEQSSERWPLLKETAQQSADDAVEIRLRDMLGRVLNKDVADIGTQSEFSSLGGDSFSAMELVALCKAEGLVLTVRDVASSSTIRSLGAIVKTRLRETGLDAPQVRGSSLSFVPAWWQPTLITA
ncbi:hypothetical protein GQX73_g5993 [Xylaria multiplex]|uniref:Carrier domain-containing protein n=1 Tax=Xylaria multiplex TaxID=323545 RepID=A0A7C8MWV0_9PEZI|nr:hypothetical protein GQX73_g5993 [Xylaria multiplex]